VSVAVSPESSLDRPSLVKAEGNLEKRLNDNKTFDSRCAVPSKNIIMENITPCSCIEPPGWEPRGEYSSEMTRWGAHVSLRDFQNPKKSGYTSILSLPSASPGLIFPGIDSSHSSTTHAIIAIFSHPRPLRDHCAFRVAICGSDIFLFALQSGKISL
jgi:hypothetical protein